MNDAPMFTRSIYANKADLYEAKYEFIERILREALSEYAIKNNIHEAPEDHWTRKVINIIAPPPPVKTV